MDSRRIRVAAVIPMVLAALFGLTMILLFRSGILSKFLRVLSRLALFDYFLQSSFAKRTGMRGAKRQAERDVVAVLRHPRDVRTGLRLDVNSRSPTNL